MVYGILLLTSIFILSAIGTYVLESLEKKLIGTLLLIISFALTWVYAIYFIIGIVGVGVFVVGVVVGYILGKLIKQHFQK